MIDRSRSFAASHGATKRDRSYESTNDRLANVNKLQTKTDEREKMNKIITILMSCSLALAVNAIAQQEEQQQKPRKEKAQPAKSRPANEARPAPKQGSTSRQHAETNAAGHEKGPQPGEPTYKPHTATKVTGKEPGPANAGKERIEQRNQERSTTNESETETANKPLGPAPATEREQYNSAAGAPQPNRPNAQANRLNAQKKPDAQAIQKIKTEHANFRAQPRPDKVPAATFNQNYRISGSQQWQGPQYEVFRSYRPEWHDQAWYRSHYNRVELIGGGYYYWNNGYWYPAWGYDPSAQYYAYDAPIYVGSGAEPPDRVIADVQAALQEMGYYQGEVDGLLGPLTREALTAYQTDHGLYTTAVIDEPTLSSLGMG
jgi:putative peptidoglycan binding protein